MGTSPQMARCPDSDMQARLIEVFTNYHTRHLRVAARTVGLDRAEDAVQDAYANAWRFRHTFRQDANLASWVHAIVVNCACSIVRPHKRYYDREIPFAEGFDCRSGDPSPEQVAYQEQRSRDMLACIEKQTPILRDVMLAYLAEDEFTGCTVQARKNRKMRAVAILEKQMRRLGYQ